MDGMSIWHLIIVVVLFVAFLMPIARILHRAGLSRAWCLLFFVPLGNLIGLWAFAYTRWPALEPMSDNAAPDFH
jgi:uncharacterized membrane protein YhaH (DUF805 family)